MGSDNTEEEVEATARTLLPSLLEIRTSREETKHTHTKQLKGVVDVGDTFRVVRDKGRTKG